MNEKRDFETDPDDIKGTPFDPAEALAIFDKQQRVTHRELHISGPAIIAMWGVCWFFGYGAQWATNGGLFTAADHWQIGLAIFGILIFSAVGITIFYVIWNSRGLRGIPAWSGSAYGCTWMVAFLLFGALSMKLVDAIPDGFDLGLVQSTVACLIVGMMYMFGGTLYQDKLQYALGVWILVSTAFGIFAGAPTAYLIQAVAGGGGMLIIALFGLAAERRSLKAQTHE